MAMGVLATTAFAKATVVKKNTKATKAMKPSGVAWLGDIPEGWEVVPAKALFKQEKRPTRPEDEIITAFRDGQVTLRKNRRTTGFTEATNYDTYQGIRKGDLVIHQMDAFAGCAGISDSDGMGSPILIACTPRRDDVKPRYYVEIVRIMGHSGFISALAKGVRERSADFRFETFAKQLLPLPPLPEQRAIADYLDEKCGAIDAAIAEAKKGIEEYKVWKKSLIFEAVTGKRWVGVFNAEKQSCREAEKMKPSGIPWIGEIPEGWKLARLKNCAKVFGRIGFRGYTTADIVNEGEGALSLSPSNLKDIRMDYTKRTYISWSKYEESPEIKVCKGDIVFVKTGSSYGKACIVDDMPCEATLNPQLVVLKCFSCHNRYLNYYLQTPLIKYQVELIVSGGTIPTMSQEKMGGWKIILPPLSEQQAIANYLDEKCAAIDAMVAEKEILIADLEAYKKSLIYETVTGKREVG